jgi:hypothetical protein
MDNVRIYNRALAPSEIETIYHKEAGTACKARDDGLVAHYSFDDGTSRDVSGLGHDGQDI